MESRRLDLNTVSKSKGPLLTFNITKRFRDFALECEATFDCGVTAVFGHSGSGKTTLLNCISGMDSPTGGEIELLGRTIFSIEDGVNVPAEKRRIGYVFQDMALFPHMSVLDNIMYGYKLTPVPFREIEPGQLIDLFQLSPLLDRGVANLSGGERERVALARALATSPDLLLLDEPLASLDMGFRGVIIRYLKRIWRELRTPMIYVSHSISEVMALAESALVLSDGKPVVQDRPSSLLFHPGVSTIADYATLENLLDAQVVSRAGDGGLAELRVGDVRLLVSDVYREPGEEVTVSIRAGDIILARDAPSKLSARNILPATVREIHVSGPRVLVYADVGCDIVVEITLGALEDLELREGQQVHLIVKTNGIMVLDAPNRGPEA